MKKVCISLIAFLFFSCTDIGILNDQIYEAQLESVQQSPYKSAKGTVAYIEAQKHFRTNNLAKLLRDKLKESANLKDTLWMSESFDAICVNCASDRMKLLFKDTVYSFRMVIKGKNKVGFETKVEAFHLTSKDFNYELGNSEFIEIVRKVRNKESWIADPLQYGADNCNDGDHTFLTVIYPDKRIEALYVRCWMPSFYRNKK